MAVIEFKKKKPKDKALTIILIIVILLFLLFLIRYVYGLRFKTTSVESFLSSDRIDGTGVLIRSEKVYISPTSGRVEFLVNEGEKVPVGKEVVSVRGINESLLSQIETIEKNIEELSINYYDSEENLILLDDIQDKINQGNYSDISEYLDDRINDDGNKTLIAMNIEELLKKQDELSKLLDHSNRSNHSEHAGIISYEIDGLEQVLKPKDFENYSYDKLDLDKIGQINDPKLIENISGGSPLFKVIDDYIWHIALKVDDERILEFDEGQAFNVELKRGNILRGEIVKINLEDLRGVMIIEFKDGLHEYYNDRVMDISLIKSQTKAYSIPSESILVKDGQDGVYINHIYGLVRFMPVKIIGEDGNVTYVEQGDSSGYITLDGEKVRTITKFDEVFLYPSSLEENQILK